MRERITDLPILDLKLPSSVNQLWRTRRGKVFRSSTYDAWRKEACWELLAQRPGRVEGPVEVSIALGRPDARKRHLDNAAGKTVLDCAHQVIEDDSLVTSTSARWDHTVPAERAMIVIKCPGRRRAGLAQLATVCAFVPSLLDTWSRLWKATCGYFVDKYDGENGD